MTIDVILLTWNRLGYTRKTFPALLANTNWDLVRHLVIYDDGSGDGTLQWLRDVIPALDTPASIHLRETRYRSPVETMNDYLDTEPADVFAKLDNDIVVPPGWLDRMASVLERNPALELLGMEAQMSGVKPQPDPLAVEPRHYSWVDSTHIGGVGLMRVSAFTERPRPVAKGRFGFTEWQHTHRPVRGWIAPDLLITDLSRLPGQPWQHLSWEYIGKGWERPFGTQTDLDPVYWAWWPEEEAA